MEYWEDERYKIPKVKGYNMDGTRSNEYIPF